MGRFVLLLLFSTPLFAAPVPKGKEKEPPTLIGAWEVVERQNDGKVVKATPREFWVFDADSYTIFTGITDEAELSDPKRRVLLGAKTASDPDDATALDLKEDRLHLPARVQLDGDDLQIAISSGRNKTRPAEAKPGQGVVYIKLHRVDPAKLKAK